MTDNAGLAIDERIRLMRDGMYQVLALLLSSVLGLVMVPLLLSGLGDARYGLWMTATGVAGLFAAFDLGLGMTITRDVAALDGREDTARFVVAAGHVYVLIGVLSGLAVFLIGLAVSAGLELDAGGIALARAVFLMTGVGLAADMANMYSVSVLTGLRRFGTSGVLSGAAVAVRSLGLVVCLQRGADLEVLVGWQAISSLLFLWIGLRVVARLAPRLGLAAGRFDAALVHSRLGFALSSQAATAAGVVAWRLPQVLVGTLCGSALAAPFTVAQKFPLMFELVLWRTADVLVPAVRTRSTVRAVVADMLGHGTRVTLLVALPGFIALWMIAPTLLETWVGTTSADVVLVFRLTTAAVLAEGIGHAAEQVLWGMGLATRLMLVALVRAAIVVALCVILIPPFGIVGGATAVLCGIVVGAAGYVRIAAGQCGMRVSTLIIHSVRGLVIASGVATAIAWMAGRWLPLAGWFAVVAVASLISASYLFVALGLGGLRPQERGLLAEIRSRLLLRPRE